MRAEPGQRADKGRERHDRGAIDENHGALPCRGATEDARGFTNLASAGMLQRPATGADGEPIKLHACASRLGFAVIYQKVAPPTSGRLADCCSAAMARLSPSLSPPPAGCIGLRLPHFGDAGLHLLRSVEKSARVNLSKAFQDAALEAVLRALFSIPESGDSETLSHMARAYIEGPGRPTLLDGFSKSESSFALANFRRARFQNHWRPVIDQFVLRRKASPTSAGHRDLLDLLNIGDAETGGRYRTPTSATNARPCFSRASRSWGKTSR